MIKKISIITMITIMLLVTLQPVVYGTDDDETWIRDAFRAVNSFLTEDISSLNTFGAGDRLIDFFTTIIKWVNTILVVTLFSLSAIALSYNGVKYILASDNPNELSNVKKNFRTIFTGMAYGFGAWTIWGIAMKIVTLIIKSFANY